MAGAANPSRAQPSPSMAQPSGQNVFGQSAGALTNAINMAGNVGGFSPVSASNVGTSFGYNPASASAGTAAGGINQYMNPYTQQVVDTSMADLERQRQMQMNQLGAQASAAGAFGGSRQGVAESLTNEAFARQGGQLASGLRQQGFQTALGASQQDVANQLQASLANAGFANQASQFGQQSALQASLANQQAQIEAQRLNQQAQLQQNQLGLSAAGQLGNLAQTGFGMGMDINQQQMQQGMMQQALQQQLIDAARGQYAGFTGAPQASLGLPMAALGAANMGQQTATQTRQPGLFDFLSLGLGGLGALRG